MTKRTKVPKEKKEKKEKKVKISSEKKPIGHKKDSIGCGPGLDAAIEKLRIQGINAPRKFSGDEDKQRFIAANSH